MMVNVKCRDILKSGIDFPPRDVRCPPLRELEKETERTRQTDGQRRQKEKVRQREKDR